VKLKTDVIHTDGGTQPRATTDQSTVTEYSEDMKSGIPFPPVVVYHDGKDYWLADGFHRVLAARVAGIREIEADVQMGTKRDALLYACGANAAHGMRRTNEDKRRVVKRLLEDVEWAKWSDREIAKRCRVGPDMVGDLRRSLSENDSEPRTYTTKHGTEATMKTDRIGKTKPQRDRADPEMPRRPPEPEPEPVVDAEQPGDDPEISIGVFKRYVDLILSGARGMSARHMVINEMIKYLRGLSIELNRKAGAA
jgi:hypothetical protein